MLQLSLGFEHLCSLSLGSAGLLLLTPSARSDRFEEAMFPENQPRRRPAHSVEAQIGRKLQMIGDQFYQEHMLVSNIMLPVHGNSTHHNSVLSGHG